MPRHFLDLDRFDEATLRHLLVLGEEFKREGGQGQTPLNGKTLAMVFECPSTRTRVSFEVGMRQLGGDVVLLSEAESQLGRGETIADTARVLSRYVDGIMLRTKSAENLKELAQYATVPVINGLTDLTHPCQILADIMTFEQHKGPITGKPIAWLGDGNNVAASWIQASAKLRFPLRLGCPAGLGPKPSLIEWAKNQGADVELTEDPEKAVRGLIASLQTFGCLWAIMIKTADIHYCSPIKSINGLCHWHKKTQFLCIACRPIVVRKLLLML